MQNFNTAELRPVERARARVLAEEDAEEAAQGGRRRGRAARQPMLSARLRIAFDLSYKGHPSLPVSASPDRRARGCTGERPRA